MPYNGSNGSGTIGGVNGAMKRNFTQNFRPNTNAGERDAQKARGKVIIVNYMIKTQILLGHNYGKIARYRPKSWTCTDSTQFIPPRPLANAGL